MGWAERWRRRGWWGSLLLRPLSLAYRAAWALDRLRHRGRPWAAPVPVLSVGNLSVGGTGKSPVVRLLAARAAAQGRRPAILLRGYGAARGARPLRVSGGRGPLVDAAHSGDEAQEHAALRGVDVWVDADRRRGAQAAVAAGAGALVLDDGFQRRWQLARGLDLLLADWQDLQGGEALLPAGPWREPWSQAAQASALLMGSAPPGLSRAALRRALPPAWAGLPLFTLERRACGLRRWPDGARLPLSRLKRRRVLALSGLGRPESFEAGLRALGALPTPWRFADHHRFNLVELSRPPAPAPVVVTTAKDAVRLPSAWRPPQPVWVLELEAVVSPARGFEALVDAALAGRPARARGGKTR